MPSLRVTLPDGTTHLYPLHKTITSIGSGGDNDIVIPDLSVSDSHAHVDFDGRDFTLAAMARSVDLVINGKRRRRHRLAHGDLVKLGAAELGFSMYDEAPAKESRSPDEQALASYRRVVAFSQELLRRYDVPALLESLMDAVVGLTSADKGFLILLEEEALRVKVARNLRRENLADALAQLSDSIIDKVIKSKEPIIVSDALHDREFANAMSVMSLRLSSVICVPLMERGHLFGVIYVGNDSVTQLFDTSHLEVLTVFAAQASLIIRNALLVNELQLDNRSLSEQLKQVRFGEIIGACAAMQEVFKKVQKVATTDISVLITGETGTGKELIARELHRRSARAKGPFITINCGAIPENLLESELFGHVRGAFTGAVSNRPGKFHAADGGTLFLDEIGEMSPALQVKLLRVLQDKVVTRVGDTRSEPVDIHVLAATHRHLESDIKQQRFREDLYYRLNVVNIHLPPLRERGDDVMVIAKYLLHRYTEELGVPVKSFSASAAIAIRKFEWPGNIRQLENHIKKACVLSDQALLSPEDLGLLAEALPSILPLAEAREQFQRDYINRVLALNNGNRTKTARDLGVDPRTIFRHLERDDSDPEDGPDEPPPPGG